VYTLYWDTHETAHSIEKTCTVDLQITGFTVFVVEKNKLGTDVLISASRIDSIERTEEVLFSRFYEKNDDLDEIVKELSNRIIILLDAEKGLTANLNNTKQLWV
jgi:hypothetical protein